METPKGQFKTIWKVFPLVILMLIQVDLSIGAEDPAKFPSKPITMIIQWAVGGSADLSGRKLADLAGKILGQPIVVENKVGGGGVIGANAVAKAAPDGHTIGVATYGPTVYAPHLRSVPYNTKEDFTWIMQYSDTIMVFTVRADSRWKTFREFIEEARKNPGKVTFSSPGHLSGQHIFMEQVFAIEKVKVTHVPVSGGAEAVVQHLGGHVDGVLTSEVCPHVISGKLRGLAAQAEKRHERFPDIPTFFELGYKIDPVIWFGIYAPKGLDPIVFRKLYDAFKKAYEDPSFKEFLASLQTLTPIFRDSESFKTKVERDFDNQAKVLKEFGFVK